MINHMANFFAQQTGIEIPKDVLKFYALHEKKDIDFEFIRLFKYQYESCKNGQKPYLSVLISEAFALEILKLIYAIPNEERMEVLFNKISNHSFNGINKKIYFENNKLYSGIDHNPIEDDIEEFILDEIFYSVNDYDYAKNEFNFHLIQTAYENLQSDCENIKVILILYADCGGEGGIIVRGKHLGYSAGYAHIDESYIVFNEKRIAYRGFIQEKYESPYIDIDKRKLS